MRDNLDQIEADFQRFYNLDIAGYFRGEISLRRMFVLISNLPPESVLARALSDVPPGWDLHAYLLADLFQATTGEVHPNRPRGAKKSKADVAERTARLKEQQQRLANRRKPTSE